jgi:hypothetical protein
MRVLVDISHPSQVHFFKNLILRFRRNKDKVLITARKKDVTIDLVRNLNLKYVCLSEQKNGMLAMAIELIVRYIKMWAIVRRFKPDILIAETGVTVGLIGTILRIPRIVEEDTEHAKLQRMIGLPFVSIIMTGLGYLANHGSRERKFKGVWVQSYLSPEYFTSDASILAKAGIEANKPYIVLRMVSWSAAHDTGLHGYDEAGYLDIIKKLSKYGRVIISSEEALHRSKYIICLPSRSYISARERRWLPRRGFWGRRRYSAIRCRWVIYRQWKKNTSWCITVNLLGRGLKSRKNF